MKSDELFENVFCSSKKGLVLNSSECALARFIYCAAVDEIRSNHKNPDEKHAVDDTIRKITLNKEIEATVKIFQRVVKLFNATEMAKSTFLNNFDRWSASRKNNINNLRKIADDIQADKFNCDVSKVVGSAVGIAGGVALGLSFIPPLAPVTLPFLVGGAIASVAGAADVVGTTVTEIAFLKTDLVEYENLIQKEAISSSKLDYWFNHTKEMTEAIESLVESSLLREMCEELTCFRNEIKKTTSLTLDELKKRFNLMLKSFVKKLSQKSRTIAKFGEVIAPVVVTFVIIVCLLRQHNRIVFNYIGQMYRLMVKGLTMPDAQVTTEQIFLVISKTLMAGWRIFFATSIALDVLTMVKSSIDIHNRTEVKQAKQIRKAALGLEEESSFVERVHDAVKNWRYDD